MTARSIRPVSSADYGEVFTLQRAAFVDEARLYETPYVPALDETFEELTSRLNDSTSWVATLGERIVGAVSVRNHRDAIPDVERLMVAPDCRGQGIASVLLNTAEDHARQQGHPVVQLIVGDLATDNRALYRHLGWVEQNTDRLAGFDHVILHTMTKQLSP